MPPHHIKTYQIEKYEETNLESVMSAIHFMVTTQHFVKGQMRVSYFFFSITINMLMKINIFNEIFVKNKLIKINSNIS